jgi:hypothetical protein
MLGVADSCPQINGVPTAIIMSASQWREKIPRKTECEIVRGAVLEVGVFIAVIDF